MSRKFLVSIDLNQNQLLNGVLHVLAADVGSPVEGQIWFNSVSNTIKYYDGTTTQEIGTAAGLTQEQVEDIVGAQLVTNGTHTGISATYDDAGDGAIDLTVSAEFISDTVGAMTTGNTETGITVTYQDGDNTIDFEVDPEFIRDTIGTTLVAGNNIDVTVNDGGDTITIDVETLAPADIVFAATDRILGRDTAAGGAGEELTVSGGLEFTGTGIQRSALTGDVTATAGSNTTAIAAGVIVDADVNASAAILFSKLATTNTDRLLGRDTAAGGAVEEITVGGGVEFTGSTGIQRSALTGDVTATAGSNTTAIAAGVIVDADVNASAAIAATKLAFTPADTIAATTVQAAIVEALTDARTYADTLSSGFDYKASVRAATTGPITISTALNNADTLDGVTLATNDRVLVKDQASGSENGIYVVGAVPARSTDADTSAEVTGGMTVWVNEGTSNADTQWTLTTNDAIVLDTTALVFAQTNALGQITAGNALTKTGNTLDVAAGTGLEISSDTIRIAAAAAGSGLTGGAGSALAVGAGTGITVNADDVALAATAAGAGLTHTTGVLAVGAGTGITVNADDVALAATAAGAGLTHTTGVLAVGAGNGITVNADDVALASSTGGAGLTYTTGVLAVGAGDGITVAADAVSLASSSGGAGLTYTTGVLAVGAGTGISVAADAISVDTAVVARKAVGALTGGATSEVLTHNLGTRDVMVQIIDNSTPWAHFEVDVESTSTNTVTVRSTVNLPASYRWVVIG